MAADMSRKTAKFVVDRHNHKPHTVKLAGQLWRDSRTTAWGGDRSTTDKMPVVTHDLSYCCCVVCVGWWLQIEPRAASSNSVGRPRRHFRQTTGYHAVTVIRCRDSCPVDVVQSAWTPTSLRAIVTTITRLAQPCTAAQRGQLNIMSKNISGQQCLDWLASDSMAIWWHKKYVHICKYAHWL